MTDGGSTEESITTQQRTVFLFLVAFRWASLVPGLWAVLVNKDQAASVLITPLSALIIAIANTLLVSLAHQPLNRQLRKYPLLLLVDIGFVVSLLGVSGGTNSPYFLYALSPVLAGAFFFQMRGALASAGVFSFLYLCTLLLLKRYDQGWGDSGVLINQYAQIWLIAVLFGYPSVLLRQLGETHKALSHTRDDLAQQNNELLSAHRQLELIYDLTVSLQSAPDILMVQDRVLGSVTRGLGFKRAVIGTVNPITGHLENWQASPEKPVSRQRSLVLALKPENGWLARSLLEQVKPDRFPVNEPLGANPALNEWLGRGPWFCIPLILRDNPVGVLLVCDESSELDNVRWNILLSVSSQAAIALGTTMLCVDRAQRLGVEQERNRIARDIHDTVAQSLFGIVFSLEGIINMLPDKALEARQELRELRSLASNVRQQVRKSIYDLWPAELEIERFKSDLVDHVNQCSTPRPFQVEFLTQGDFDHLPFHIRRTLYQVVQEALTNTARHAGVDSARVELNVSTEQVRLVVQDEGHGFNAELILVPQADRKSFGLVGIQDRVRAIGGEISIISQKDKGTQVKLTLPVV